MAPPTLHQFHTYHHISESLLVAGLVGHLTHTGTGLRLLGLFQSEAKSLDQHYHRVSQAVQDSHLDKEEE